MALKPGYKQSEVGVIPEDWEVKELNFLLTGAHLGGNYPNQLSESSYPLMKMGNVERGQFDVSKIEYVRSGIAPGELDRLRFGDLLFNTRNTLDLVGKVAIWRDELPVAFFNSNLLRFEFRPEAIVSNAYANYAFNSAGCLNRLRALATGTTSVAAIYTRDLLKFPFCVPPPPEQHAIAAALSDLDALISVLDQLIAKKRDIKLGAMQQLLTGKRRLPGFRGEWEVRKIGEFTDCTAGGTPSTSVPTYWGGHLRWMNSGELNMKIVNDVEGRITEEGLRNCSAKMIPVKCVLIGLAGQGKTRGTVAINLIELCTNQSIAAIYPNESFVPEYLYYNLDSRYYEIRGLSTGNGGRGGLNLGIIKSIEVPFPKKCEQHAIATVLSDMDAEITALEQKRHKTRLLKQGMMQELLTGRVRLV